MKKKYSIVIIAAIAMLLIIVDFTNCSPKKTDEPVQQTMTLLGEPETWLGKTVKITYSKRLNSTTAEWEQTESIITKITFVSRNTEKPFFDTDALQNIPIDWQNNTDYINVHSIREVINP